MSRLNSLLMEAPGSAGWSQRTVTESLGPEYADELLNTCPARDGRLRSRPALPVFNTPSDARFGTVQQRGDDTFVHVLSETSGLFEITSDGVTRTAISGAVASPTSTWRLVPFKNNVVGFKSGQTPITRLTSGTGNFAAIVATSDPLPTGDIAMSAYGRLWAVKSPTERDVLMWSDLLIETAWNSGTGVAGAGILDLKTVWDKDGDVITGLAAYNGKLIIFGRRHVVIYAGAKTPTIALVLDEQITGVGCVATDSIQNVGNDLLFLSADGVRSLKRLIASDTSAPVLALSTHIDDYVRGIIAATPALDGWWSAHDRTYQVYLLAPKGATDFICGGTRLLDTDAQSVAWSLWRNGAVYGGYSDALGRAYLLTETLGV